MTRDIERHKAREAEAARFEAAFLEHWSRVYEIAFHLVGDRDEAQDLALETFWRLYRQPPRVWENLSGWLFRVVTNLGLNTVRARDRRERYQEQGGRIELAEESSQDPQGELERSEERRQVRMVLRRMNPRAAQLLLLRHAGLSYAEIAEAASLNPKSVGKMLARAEDEFERLYRQMEGGE